jgi:hypothetical protein
MQRARTILKQSTLHINAQNAEVAAHPGRTSFKQALSKASTVCNKTFSSNA